MSIPSLQIGTATRAELDLMVEWAAGEGWNPGLADADCFHAADPAGFLVGRLDDEPVGCISVVTYQPAFAFLGFYIVRSEHRGQGYGLRLWQAGMARLENRVVGLDGVIAQQENYKRSGFVLAHRNIRFGGAPTCEPPRDGRLVAIDADKVDAVLAYDRAFFPGRARRVPAVLAAARSSATGLALIEDGTVRGYGVIRACRQRLQDRSVVRGHRRRRRPAFQSARGRRERRGGFSRLSGAEPAGNRTRRPLWPVTGVRDRAHVSRHGADAAAASYLRDFDLRARLGGLGLAGGAPRRVNNQSVMAMLSRTLGPESFRLRHGPTVAPWSADDGICC